MASKGARFEKELDDGNCRSNSKKTELNLLSLSAGDSADLSGRSFRKESGHRKLIEVSASQSGEQLWLSSPFAESTEKGRLGCAASASVVLREAGFKYANSPTVGGLQAQLLKHGWTKHAESEMKEGDVMIAVNS
ncbi:MAG: hypothetical protein K2X27_12610, partial [Candidatus Obscuribacterales bacterium]|nr:hypothetical protein [Candidatus Obscuribacterales bacterium]